MKNISKFIVLFWACIHLTFAQNIDVLHYDLSIVIKNFTQKNIYGQAIIHYELKQNADSIFFEINHLTVDSVIYHAQQLSLTQRADSLWIKFPSTVFPAIDSITIYYSGEPGKDPANLGGFYFQDSSYAFNIGVSFMNDPHNFGKAWFPCRDNFQDKATFTYHIHVDSGKTATCGGILYQIDTLPDHSRIYHWNLITPIPPYLASVAVANFVAVKDTVLSINNTVIPIELYGLPADTNKTKGTFSHLKHAFHIFESLFGPYLFQRIGYVMVPFNAGAMEHACNIAFPKAFVSGSSALDYIMAHELSHHWFGNLVTCNHQENMWLNEGWANYCEALFFEFYQDKKAYKDYVRSLHEDVLRRAHILDGSYLPITPMPASYTYGTTVYKKGATTLHTLRSYLGDSLFFGATRHYLNQFAFQSASTENFQQAFENYTQLNLTRFVNDWLKTPGFAHFGLDSFKVIPYGNGYQTQIYIHQRLKEKPNFIEVHLPVALWSKNWERKDTTIYINNEYTNATVYTAFEPLFIMLDPEEKIADATVDEYQIAYGVTSLPFDKSYGNVSIVKLNGVDSCLVHFTHHFISPGGDQPEKGIYVGNRYWEVNFISPDTGFQAKAIFRYNGGSTGTTGYIDADWWNTVEDSLVLLYKEKMHHPWQIWDSTVHQKGSSTDKIGYFEARYLKPGFFAIGYKDTVQTINRSKNLNPYYLHVYPNPSTGNLFLETNLSASELANAQIFIYNSLGQLLLQLPYKKSISLAMPSGYYYMELKTPAHSFYHKLLFHE
jgi:aminopeptidase N